MVTLQWLYILNLANGWTSPNHVAPDVHASTIYESLVSRRQPTNAGGRCFPLPIAPADQLYCRMIAQVSSECSTQLAIGQIQPNSIADVPTSSRFAATAVVNEVIAVEIYRQQGAKSADEFLDAWAARDYSTLLGRALKEDNSHWLLSQTNTPLQAQMTLFRRISSETAKGARHYSDFIQKIGQQVSVLMQSSPKNLLIARKFINATIPTQPQKDKTSNPISGFEQVLRKSPSPPSFSGWTYAVLSSAEEAQSVTKLLTDDGAKQGSSVRRLLNQMGVTTNSPGSPANDPMTRNGFREFASIACGLITMKTKAGSTGALEQIELRESLLSDPELLAYLDVSFSDNTYRCTALSEPSKNPVSPEVAKKWGPSSLQTALDLLNQSNGKATDQPSISPQTELEILATLKKPIDPDLSSASYQSLKSSYVSLREWLNELPPRPAPPTLGTLEPTSVKNLIEETAKKPADQKALDSLVQRLSQHPDAPLSNNPAALIQADDRLNSDDKQKLLKIGICGWITDLDRQELLPQVQPLQPSPPNPVQPLGQKIDPSSTNNSGKNSGVTLASKKDSKKTKTGKHQVAPVVIVPAIAPDPTSDAASDP